MLLGLAPDTPIKCEYGDSIDLSSLEQQIKLPNSTAFRYIKHYNQRTSRWSQEFICDYDNCHKIFKKWHNLFDHLRIHTNERPFRCPVMGCRQGFTQ